MNQKSPIYTSSLGKGTQITHETLTAKSHLQITGEVKLNIECNGKLIITETGSVQGNIKAKELNLLGSVEGSVWVEKKMSMSHSASLSGYVSADRIKIETGAFCQCTSNIGKGAEKRYQDASLKSGRSNGSSNWHENGISKNGRSHNQSAAGDKTTITNHNLDHLAERQQLNGHRPNGQETSTHRKPEQQEPQKRVNGSGANGSGDHGSGANGSGDHGSGANGSGANGSGYDRFW